MDNGETIPALNEPWTFGGAKLSEWMAGFVSLMTVQTIFLPPDKMGRWMPVLLAIWVITTFALAALRKMHPDEERGVRNRLMVAVGVPPPGIPSPALIQPVWSGFPMRELPNTSRYVELNLGTIFIGPPIEEDEGMNFDPTSMLRKAEKGAKVSRRGSNGK